MTLLAAVLIAALQSGTIQVFVDPGFEIFLDSQTMGTSAGRGLQISDVAPGEHIVTVKTPWGTQLSQKVSVLEGEIVPLPIASIGLRSRPRGDASTVTVQVKTTAPLCDLAMGANRISAKPAELQLNSVPSGPYRVTLTCGGKTAASDMTVPPGRLITLEADLKTGRMKVVNDESRITQMKVRTTDDVIMAMDLPLEWRRAIVASITEGVTINSISQQGDKTALITTTSTYSQSYKFGEKLEKHPAVRDVDKVSSRYLKAGSGYEITYRVTFKAGA